MAELTPSEKLQPCLLDRLRDDDPQNPLEGRNQRVVSAERYRRGVIRDLEWLLSTPAPDEEMGGVRLADYPHAHRSVLSFGTRSILGMISPDLRTFEQELVDAIRLYEPRILRQSLKIKAAVEGQVISFDMNAEVWATPLPEHLFIRTQIDLENGQCLFGEDFDGRASSPSL